VQEEGKKVLSCLCSMRCGSLNPTKMVLDGSCRAFGNSDGVLFCDKEMENDENVPKGDYEKDCGGCSFEESTQKLTCKKCLTPRGQFAESSLVVKEGCEVVNAAGALKCRDKPQDTMSDDNAEKKEL